MIPASVRAGWQAFAGIAFATSMSMMAGGCAIPDIAIRHPLVVGGVDQNRILKNREMDEASRGFQRGVLSDEAQLLELNAERACFGVRLTDLQSIDLNGAAGAKLRIAGMKEVSTPDKWPDAPTVADQPGLVPERYYAGRVAYCSYYGRYRCLVWSTRPSYATRMVRGTIPVYATSSRMCFQHLGAIDPKTKWVSLEVIVDRLNGGFAKQQTFTWELSGARK